MMDFERVERLIGTDALSKLTRAHVAVVGLGSGGGFVALSLAMSGVGRFTLVDMDTLEPANLSRHVADARHLGRNKAESLADLIRQRNPDAQLTVVADDIARHPKALDSVDLLLVGVDGEQTKYLLNTLCLERGLTAVYAGVYARGEGGDACVIRPHDGPCYACWAAELRDGRDQVPSEALDYGLVAENGTLKGEPALWLHVTRVASAQADIALTELLRGTGARPEFPANTVVMANNALEIIEGQITPPHSALWVNIARDPHCLVCGDGARAASDSISLDDLMASDVPVISDEQETDAAKRRLEDSK
jgi:molybdopterin/thiamine biosynthesis adenylyltransferase